MANEQSADIASGVAEDPLEFTLIRRGGEISPRHQQFLERLATKNNLGRGLAVVGKREVTATDIAILTQKTGHEYALVILKDNRRVIVDVGSYKGGTLPSNTKVLIMHSHPDDYGCGMAKFISEADVDALVFLEQRYSYMVTVDGTVYRFTRNTIPNSVGEVVRKLGYIGWVKPED